MKETSDENRDTRLLQAWVDQCYQILLASDKLPAAIKQQLESLFIESGSFPPRNLIAGNLIAAELTNQKFES